MDAGAANFFESQAELAARAMKAESESRMRAAAQEDAAEQLLAELKSLAVREPFIPNKKGRHLVLVFMGPGPWGKEMPVGWWAPEEWDRWLRMIRLAHSLPYSGHGADRFFYITALDPEQDRRMFLTPAILGAGLLGVTSAEPGT